MLGCVAGRTIEIDLESYELLTASKRFGESFSSLIKRMLQAERHAASHLLVHIADDPVIFTRPFTVAVPMRRSDEPMFEHACHEGNYGLLNILSGARAEDAAAR